MAILLTGLLSQGVVKVKSLHSLKEVAIALLAEREVAQAEGKGDDAISVPRYGNALILEEFLDGTELTVTVMPPGDYALPCAGSGDISSMQVQTKEGYWALPPVTRFNHQDGVAPYNGVVAVVQNSRLLR